MLQISKLGMWDHLGYPLFKTKSLSIKTQSRQSLVPQTPSGILNVKILDYLCQTKYY